MQEQKKYHHRKLAIIEMIEECERRVRIEFDNMEKFRNLPNAHSNSKFNFRRYQDIKSYLINRY